MALDGFLNLLKPPGPTSHDMVAFARRCLRINRVGHLGTLDPAAAGVLPICVGRATRLFGFVEGRKAYRAEILFGTTTDTLDAEGVVLSRADASEVTLEALREQLAARLGQQEQSPPSFSAVQVGGKRLHELARRGEAVAAPARTVTFYSLDLIEFETRPRGPGDPGRGMLGRNLYSRLGARSRHGPRLRRLSGLPAPHPCGELLPRGRAHSRRGDRHLARRITSTGLAHLAFAARVPAFSSARPRSSPAPPCWWTARRPGPHGSMLSAVSFSASGRCSSQASSARGSFWRLPRKFAA